MIYRYKMVKSTSVVYFIFVSTIFLRTYDAKNVGQPLGTAPQVTQTNQSVQYEARVSDSMSELQQDNFVPDLQTAFGATNSSDGEEVPDLDGMMKEYLSSMIASVKAQQKIRESVGVKMYEAFSEGALPYTIVGVYERDRNGSYRHVCSGAVINYFHVITAASCVWSETTSRVKDPSSFLVVAGRPSYPGAINDDVLEPGEQRFQASHLQVPKTFTGTAGNAQSDLAIVRLATVVKLTDSVDFIRLDWANYFVGEPNDGVQEGLFVASGNAIEDGIRYVNVSACNEVNITSPDKRCARFTGPTVASVNYGAPFVVYHAATRIHYLRGVLSWTSSDKGQKVVEFTSVSDERTLMWINEAATGLFDPPASYKKMLPGFYSWNNQHTTWPEAKASCEADGNYTYLAFPTKETEYDAMFYLFTLYQGGPMSEAWVGFTDRDKEGDIVSLFGLSVDSYEDVHWSNTDNVTKNEEDADCVMLTNVGGEPRPVLTTSSCEERRPFICGFCLECALLDSAFGEAQGVSRYLAHSTVE